MSKIHLAEATIDEKDMDALADWIKTYPRLTKGPLTLDYEQKWGEYIGVKHSTFVNSGSSANLLMLAALLESGDLKVGDAVVVPALSWATDLSPVMQLGLTPVLCDCNLQDLSLDKDHLLHVVKKERPKAIILVSVLGLVPDMSWLVNLCDKEGVILLEDCCESLGSEYEGQKLGSFGAMSTFSTYFGHHISTIEGGMVCTNDTKYDKILKSIRSHGWDRDLDKESQESLRKEWGVSEFDAFYTFYHKGFNVRATDLQAFLGLRQLDKLDLICDQRSLNFKLYQKYLNPEYKIEERREGFTSNFAYPIVSKNRNAIAKRLMKEDIECRPLICGSMGKQPFYVKEYGEKSFTNADFLKERGMYIPNHHLLKEQDINLISRIVNFDE
tara:strand:- start:4318 stop:5472 length:1155 start_codon:yes stop_codon:yes gene_type:complete